MFFYAYHSPFLPLRRIVALFFACLVCTALWAEAAQGQLADKVIRLHVLANSDSQADQALKRYVRDQVLAQTTPLLEGVTSAPEAEAILQANLGLLTQTAQAAIAARGTIIPSRSVWRKPGSPPGNTRTWPSPPGTTRPCGCSSVRLRGTTGGVWSSLPLPAGRQRGFPGGRRLSQQDYALIQEETPAYTFQFHVVEWWEGFKHWWATRG